MNFSVFLSVLLGTALLITNLPTHAAAIYGITGSGVIRGYDIDTEVLLVDFGPNSGNQGLAAGDSVVFANISANGTAHGVHAYDAVTGTLLDIFGDVSTRDIAYADGILYGISGSGEILSYDAGSGQFLGGFGANTGGQALAAGDGYVYTDLGLPQGDIHKYDMSTKQLVLSFGDSLSGTGLAYADGIVYSYNNGELLSYDADTGNFLSGFGANSGGTHIAAGNGKVYVVAGRNGVTGSIHEYDAYSHAYVRSFGDVNSLRQIAFLSTVPIPAAIWLFGSGLIGLLGFRKLNKEV